MKLYQNIQLILSEEGYTFSLYDRFNQSGYSFNNNTKGLGDGERGLIKKIFPKYSDSLRKINYIDQISKLESSNFITIGKDKHEYKRILDRIKDQKRIINYKRLPSIIENVKYIFNYY
jgi:hypothetical protein